MIDLVKHRHNSCFHGTHILGKEIVKKEGKPTNKWNRCAKFYKRNKTRGGVKKRGRYALSKMLVAGITMNQNSETSDFICNQIQNMQIENSNRTYLALVINWPQKLQISGGIFFLFFLVMCCFPINNHSFLGVIFWARGIVSNVPCQSHMRLINSPHFYVSDVLLKIAWSVTTNINFFL